MKEEGGTKWRKGRRRRRREKRERQHRRFHIHVKQNLISKPIIKSSAMNQRQNYMPITKSNALTFAYIYIYNLYIHMRPYMYIYIHV